MTTELAADLAYDLIRVLKLMHALRDRAPRIAQGLDPTTQPLIHKLARCDSTRVTDLAADLHADVSTISRYASTLAHAGLVEKTADPADRRVQMLTLTDAGREAVASLYQQRADSFARILRDWTPSEVIAFRGFVTRFADDLARDLAREPNADAVQSPPDAAASH
jgi:DNA-binding MarR family transcriptional regulator